MALSMLFKKGNIGNVRIKNRIAMTSMTLGYSETNGEPSNRLIRYYEERAKGGAGLIFSEIIRVNEEHGVLLPRQMSASNPSVIGPMSVLTDTVHQYDTKIFAQLQHGGNGLNPLLNHGVIYSCSNIPAASGIVPTPFTTEQIQSLVNDFVKAAVICRQAGFDGVEIHGAHSYLIAQFMSKYYNKRDDQYGGSFENRMRFPSEIIKGIRTACGKDFPISIRINGEEFTADTMPGSITLEDGVQNAQAMEQAGVDVINVSVCNAFSGNTAIEPYSYEEGWRSYVTKSIKEAVKIPVIGTNTIKNPDFAENLLQDGVSDFIGVGRSQLSDPEWANKAMQNRSDEIRKCIGCLYCFESLLNKGSSECMINPRLGKESVYGELQINGSNRPLSVVGGGPAGLQAATILARRGFDVVLYEKEGTLGGTLNIADKVATYKDKITKLRDVLEKEARASGVTIQTGIDATPNVVARTNPEAVFLACGAKATKLAIPGIGGKNVVLATDILSGTGSFSGSVAVIGSGLTGLEASEKLLNLGCKELCIVEMEKEIGPGIYLKIKQDIMSRISVSALELLASHRLDEINNNQMVLTNLKNGEIIQKKVDTIVLALGVTPEQEIIQQFDNSFDHVIVLGDAKKGGRIHDALKDAMTAAYGFSC